MLDNLTDKIYLKSIWFALIFWKLTTVFPISWGLVENSVHSVSSQGERMFRETQKVILNDVWEMSFELICSLTNYLRFWLSLHWLLGPKNVFCILYVCFFFHNKVLLIVILLTYLVFPYNHFQGQGNCFDRKYAKILR